MPPPIQKNRLRIDFGAPATPWSVTAPHGLADWQANGILPNLADIVRVEIQTATGFQSLPNGSAAVVAMDATNVTVVLPPATDWLVAPISGRVWIDVERVHSIQGFYARAADVAPPGVPYGSAGGAGGFVSCDLWVDQKVGNDVFPGTSELPKLTIGAAVAVAVAGFPFPYRIHVGSGVYDEQITLPPSITIQGIGEVYIVNSTGDVVTIPNGANNVHLFGIVAEIQGAVGGLAALHYSDATGKGCKFTNCEFYAEDVTNSALIVDDGADLMFENCLTGGGVNLFAGVDDVTWKNGAMAGDVAGNPILLATSCNRFRLATSQVRNINAAALSDAVIFDGCTDPDIVGSDCLANGGIGIRFLNATIGNASFFTAAGAGGSWEVDATSSILLGAGNYNPTTIIVAGGVQHVTDSDSIGADYLNPASWAAPAPPLSMRTAIDRIAAALAGVLGFPIP